MPLNYRKWDNLELSDDSDVERHPNVDHQSMIRWKQRDIHEKREARRLKIAQLKTELSLNAVLRPRVQTILDGVSSKGVDHFRSVQRRLREQPSDEKPNTGHPNQPTYDMMMSQLLGDIFREAAWVVEGAAEIAQDGKVLKGGKKVEEKDGQPSWADGAIPENKAETLSEVLQKRLKWHLEDLTRRDKEIEKEIEVEEAEQKKKITSDDIREGWSKTSVSASKPSPLDDKPKTAKKEKAKTETIEVLNPGAGSSSSSAVTKPAAATSDPVPDPDDDIEFGPLTESERSFASISIGDFEKSFHFIQKDSSVLTEKTYDSLLAEAFDAERRGDKDFAKKCVHQSLLINYCRQLGRDGVGLFFQKMIAKNPKSIQMFWEDFNRTYGRIDQRTKEILAEEASREREQIQLVAEDPNMTIAFNLPDGPPPEDLRVEGEGSETLDIEQVRAFLQRKWEIFEGFPEKLKVAMKSEKLEEVNKVLADMKVAEAEEVVELMQEGGMLSFSERGVRDMTHQE